MLLALDALMSESGSDSEQDIPSEFVLQPSAAPSARSTSADGYDPAAFALGSSSDDEAADATPMRTEQHRDWAGLSRTPPRHQPNISLIYQQMADMRLSAHIRPDIPYQP